MRWALVLLLVACGSRPPPYRWDTSTRDSGMAKLVDATGRGDAAAVASLFGDSVDYGGIWFSTTPCRIEFAAAGTIPRERLDAFARCLAALRLQPAVVQNTLPQLATLAYEPGFEIEALFDATPAGPKLRWIGHVARRGDKDALPTIGAATLERLRASATTIDDEARAELDRIVAHEPKGRAAAWLKVCINADGAVSMVSPRFTSSVDAIGVFVANARRVKYRPFVVGTQPIPVCAMQYVSHPTSRPPRQTLIPVPAKHENAFLVALSLLGEPLKQQRYVPSPEIKHKIDLAAPHSYSVDTVMVFCMDETGAVDDVAILLSSGVPEYDGLVRRELLAFRFAPFVIRGQPTPVCSTWTSIYSTRMRRRPSLIDTP